MNLTELDRYAIRRLLDGKEWQSLQVSDHIRGLLSNIEKTGGQQQFQKVLPFLLSPEDMLAIFRVDSDSPPPLLTSQVIPAESNALELQPLSEAQRSAASKSGAWIREYVDWAARTANETPILFHEASAFFLGALAIGRRCYIAAPWGEQIFPNLYILLSAVSTFYRKTAALRLATRVAKTAMGHMLLPQPGSPENFINMLAGIIDLDNLSPADRARFERALPFAAQRGIVRDELSGLFKSFARDYMSGMKERILEMHDAPEYVDVSTNARGVVVARGVALSILGAATPAELRASLTEGDWYNGTLARFCVITPEPNYSERPFDPAYESQQIEAHLSWRLKTIHESLPSPQLVDSGYHTEAWSLICENPTFFWAEVKRYESALRDMTRPGSALPDQLRATYGRLHVSALKAAIITAVMDWAEHPSSERPFVSLHHWYRGVLFAEMCRESVHRFESDMNQSVESVIEDKILAALARKPATLRDLYRALHVKARDCSDALSRLIGSGLVAADGAVYRRVS